LGEGDMLITADTIVYMDGEIFGKPGDETNARDMLASLSGKTHQVITGVCLRTTNREKTFFSVTHVEFKTFTEDEIGHYIETCKPFDKAGGYGIQEWIGLIGVVSIAGSYFNVVGLPVQQLYEEIINFSNY
jgi:septum formation protein